MLSYDTLLSQERPGTLRFGGARMALLDIEGGFWGLRQQLEALAGSPLADAVLQQAGVSAGTSFAATFTAGASAEPSADSAQLFRDCLAAYQAAGFGHFEVDTLEWPAGPISVRGSDTFEAWLMRQHEQRPATPVCAYTEGVLTAFANFLAGRQDIVCRERQCQALGASHCHFEILPGGQLDGGRQEASDSELADGGARATVPGNALRIAYQVLEQRVEERTHELSILLDVSRSLVSTLELQPLLELILEKLKLVVDYDGASIMVQDGAALQVLAYQGPIARDAARRLRFPLAEAGANQEVIRRCAPVLINDVWTDDEPLAAAFRQTAETYGAHTLDSTQMDSAGTDQKKNLCQAAECCAPFTYVRSWLGVPLLTKDRCLGMLSLDHSQAGYYTRHHKQLALAFANQVATAIETARLHAYSEEMAVAAERNRLARELHDAVTQTLFSASLIAEVLPRIWQKDPAEGEARLAELRELTRGALAEMRTLLLELRPATLTESSLTELLKQLTTAVIGRSRLDVDLEIKDERPLPAEVQVALYRIAQESLNNITKHAAATRVTISLTYELDNVSLIIRDDGRGFDQATVAVQSLGLSIMGERAEKIGAALTIESEIGWGTKVTVVYPIKRSAVSGQPSTDH
jgi:signal transduction histidine kinase